MANFVVTYDLNGPRPTHKQVDDHMARIADSYARVLETVWWVSYNGTAAQLRDSVAAIFGTEDLLLVVEAESAAWTDLLVDGDALVAAWKRAA